MCGEQLKIMDVLDVLKGSPPRVRGTEACEWRQRGVVRITPACAGNSRARKSFCLCFTDHPRVCGEQMRDIHTRCREEGSPPRVRGTVAASMEQLRHLRITPACAGNSAASCPRCPLRWDHPRVCGEQAGITVCTLSLKGSPPRVRGTEARPGVTCYAARITPACAGNSLSVITAAPGIQDHPRVCGEQLMMRISSGIQKGSPPRVRGTADHFLGMASLGGITPACAGNSVSMTNPQII